MLFSSCLFEKKNQIKIDEARCYRCHCRLHELLKIFFKKIISTNKQQRQANIAVFWILYVISFYTKVPHLIQLNFPHWAICYLYILVIIIIVCDLAACLGYTYDLLLPRPHVWMIYFERFKSCYFGLAFPFSHYYRFSKWLNFRKISLCWSCWALIAYSLLWVHCVQSMTNGSFWLKIPWVNQNFGNVWDQYFHIFKNQTID